MQILPRSRLAAGALVGAVVFGAAMAVAGLRRPADPRVAAAGLLTAGILASALAAMGLARRRLVDGRTAGRPGPQGRGGRHERPEGVPDGRLTLVPLGDGQAAVLWDEPARAPAPRPAGPGDAAGDGDAAADAIWAAVEAAVLEVATGSPPAPPRPGPGGPRRPRGPWGRRRGDDPRSDSR